MNTLRTIDIRGRTVEVQRGEHDQLHIRQKRFPATNMHDGWWCVTLPAGAVTRLEAWLQETRREPLQPNGDRV